MACTVHAALHASDLGQHHNQWQNHAPSWTPTAYTQQNSGLHEQYLTEPWQTFLIAKGLCNSEGCLCKGSNCLNFCQRHIDTCMTNAFYGMHHQRAEQQHWLCKQAVTLSYQHGFFAYASVTHLHMKHPSHPIAYLQMHFANINHHLRLIALARLTVWTKQSSILSGKQQADWRPYLRRRCSLEWHVVKPTKLRQKLPPTPKPKLSNMRRHSFPRQLLFPANSDLSVVWHVESLYKHARCLHIAKLDSKLAMHEYGVVTKAWCMNLTCRAL